MENEEHSKTMPWRYVEQKMVRIWDSTTGRPVKYLPGRLARGQAFSPSRQQIALAQDNVIALLDIESGQPLQTFSGHTGTILGIAFSPDGQRLASVGQDKTLRLWEVNSGQQTQSFSWESADSYLTIRFSPDGKRLAVGGETGVLQPWDIDVGQLIQTFAGNPEIAEMAFAPDGQRIALVAGYPSSTLQVWPIEP